MNSSRMSRVLLPSLAIASAALALLALQCSSPTAQSSGTKQSIAASPAAIDAWQVIYGVLEHPRCANCHPVGDAPLQGDDQHPHAQNVQRGPDGQGLYAMRCSTCHQEANLAGAHLPPGTPKWHLPSADMKLVFVGKSSGELCRQIKDPARNGHKSIEQIFEHMAADPLVMWGWNPGEGRTPVSTPHADLVRALRTWIENDCGCPPE